MSDSKSGSDTRATPFEYDRPQQPWVCGRSPDQAPCAHGPTAGGTCAALAVCTPRREGDRWFCNRSALRGGPCDVGPDPNGTCGQPVVVCVPRRSLRARRTQWTWSLVALLVGLLCVVLALSWRNDVLAPGQLTSAHAQILQASGTQRCEACHPAASGGGLDWFKQTARLQAPFHGDNSGDADNTMSSRCLQCHQEQLPVSTAFYAHGLVPEVLAHKTQSIQESLSSDERMSVLPAHLQDPLACSTCHREHHGRNHDMSLLTNQQCQVCHAQQFTSLSDGHPEFSNWPHTKVPRIAFDHNRHAALHFPKSAAAFDCRSCHAGNGALDVQPVMDYASACAECHDRPLVQSFAVGLPVLGLPMLDAELLAEAGYSIGQWPERASGTFDGQLPTILRFLLHADARLSDALQQFRPDFDWLDVNLDDPQQLAATSEIAWGIKRLYHELHRHGQAALRGRIETALGRRLTETEFQGATAQLPADVVASAVLAWFPLLEQELSSQNGSEQATQAAAASSTRSNGLSMSQSIADSDRAADGHVPSEAGWFRDTATVAIGYRPAQHADRFVQTWVELLAEWDRNQPQRQTSDGNKLLKHAASTSLVGQCTICHAAERPGDSLFRPFGSADELLTLCWNSESAAPRAADLTRFDHTPHLTLPALADCQHCHVLESPAAGNVQQPATWIGQFQRDFQPVRKDQCTSCHTASGAGDRCTQCHRYHAIKHAP